MLHTDFYPNILHADLFWEYTCTTIRIPMYHETARQDIACQYETVQFFLNIFILFQSLNIHSDTKTQNTIF